MRSKYSKKDLLYSFIALFVFVVIALAATTTLPPITSLGTLLLLILAWGIVATNIGLIIHIALELSKRS